MANRISDARNALHAALSPVLPGRTSSVPPAGTAFVAPYIWIDQPDVAITVSGASTRLATASFPVWIAYDGAVKAQVVGLDDLVAKVWDACLTVRQATPQTSTPTTLDVGGATLRGVVVTVDYALTALSLCLPTIETAVIPPEPVLV